MNKTTLAPSRRRHLPTVIQPEHGAYETARAAWNLHADQRPAGVAIARTPEHVRDAVLFARDRGLRIVPQTTGHLAGTLPPMDDALLLRTDLHDEVDVDPVRRRARVLAGAWWEDVVNGAAPHGLAALHGSSPDVGVVGYTLGGGLSFYARRHGLAANHVTAIEVVTADGELRRVDHENEPDLFWALRGGGGNFGVVTAIEFELLPLAEVLSGGIFWPVAHAERVLKTWLEWTRNAPEGVTTSARVLHLPPVPEVPEPLRDVPVVTVDGVVLDTDDGGLLGALRDVAPPILDTWAPGPATNVLRMHGDPEQPTPALGDHALLGELDDGAIDAFLDVVGPGTSSPLLIAELRQLGGALARRPVGAGARGHLEGSFAMLGIGVPVTPELGAAIDERLASLLDAVTPWDTGRKYLNFAEGGGSADRCFDPETYARLRRVRAAYDPDERFVASHPV